MVDGQPLAFAHEGKLIMSKSVSFTAKAFNAATVSLVDACKAIDATVASKAKAINKWASVAAAGISSGALTLDAVKQSIIARYPKAETLSDCGNTIKGQFYALQRIVKAGDAYVARLVGGEAFNAVAKDSPAVQQQQTGKRASKPAKGNKRASKGITLQDAIFALSGWIDTGLNDADYAKELARNADLALLIAKVGKLQAMVSGEAKATTTKAKRRKAA